jgi:hypothetical protein
MPPQGLSSYAVVVLLVPALAAAACSGSAASSPTSADECAALGACCAALPYAAQQTTCNDQLHQARAQSDSNGACNLLLDGYHADGLCAGGDASAPIDASQTTPDAGGGSDGPVEGMQPAVCAKYVACVSATTPSALPSTIAAYGASGTCWASTPDVASACTTACKTGIAQLYGANPAVCSLCMGDTDCAAGQTCSRGTCHSCSPSSCPMGCCNSADQCMPGTANTACGTGGQSCTDCTLQMGGMCASLAFTWTCEYP